MTTPKRNEAVAPVAWVERTEEGHTRMWSGDLSLWANRPANPEPLYSQQTIDALQGEVSRLRGAKDRIQQALNAFEVPKMSASKAEYYKAGARAVIALVNANLEPPTDGR